MNKIVDKKEVKGNKNEMCSRHKVKSRTSERLMSDNPIEKYFDILGLFIFWLRVRSDNLHQSYVCVLNKKLQPGDG